MFNLHILKMLDQISRPNYNANYIESAFQFLTISQQARVEKCFEKQLADNLVHAIYFTNNVVLVIITSRDSLQTSVIYTIRVTDKERQSLFDKRFLHGNDDDLKYEY